MLADQQNQSIRQRKYGRIAGAALSAVLAASLLGACGNQDNATQPDPNYQDSTTGTGNAGSSRTQPDNAENAPADNSGTGNTEAGGDNTATNSDTNTGGATGEDLSHEGTGTFTGQQDPHTVEIETAQGPMSFQIDDITAKSIAELAPNDSVKFKYREKELQTDDGMTKQLWLTEIEKAG